MTMVSPRRFFILFFSSFLQAYIFPVERVWQAQTSPNPPLPENYEVPVNIDWDKNCFNRKFWGNKQYLANETFNRKVWAHCLIRKQNYCIENVFINCRNNISYFDFCYSALFISLGKYYLIMFAQYKNKMKLIKSNFFLLIKKSNRKYAEEYKAMVRYTFWATKFLGLESRFLFNSWVVPSSYLVRRYFCISDRWGLIRKLSMKNKTEWFEEFFYKICFSKMLLLAAGYTVTLVCFILYFQQFVTLIDLS